MPKPHYRRLADGSTHLMADGFQNVVANLGTARDKASHASYGMPIHTPADLIAAYRSAWLPRKIVDIIPMDATRRWRAWQAKADQISRIEAEENRLGLRGKLREAMTAARLFGGAVIYIGTGETDTSKPISPKRGRIDHLTVIGRDRIAPGEIDYEPASPRFGQPGMYMLNGQVKVHPSRLVVLHGAPMPAGAPVFSEWGDSALTAVFDAIRHADGTAANMASLTYEAVVDILSIPNLREMLLEPGGDAQLTKYLTTLAMAKGVNAMLVLDGGGTIEGSDRQASGTQYDRKPVSFGGLGDIWDRMMQSVAGAADIPMTRLFGMSPGGMNATGEHDSQNYHARIKAMQELELTPAMSALDELLIVSALGSRPTEIYYDWRSLNEPSDKDRADVGNITADIVKKLSDSGLFLPEVLARAGSNAMIETGALPGLEAAVDEFGLDTVEDEDLLPDADEGDT